MRKKRDAGHEGYRKVECRTGGKQERRNARKEGCRKRDAR